MVHPSVHPSCLYSEDAPEVLTTMLNSPEKHAQAAAEYGAHSEVMPGCTAVLSVSHSAAEWKIGHSLARANQKNQRKALTRKLSADVLYQHLGSLKEGWQPASSRLKHVLSQAEPAHPRWS